VGNGLHVRIPKTVENEALTMKMGVRTRNEVFNCNNRRDIKQNIKSGNGRHVRIPENNLIVILYLFHFIVHGPGLNLELEHISDLGYFSFMKGNYTFWIAAKFI